MEATPTNITFSSSVMNLFRDAVIVTNAQGYILHVNQAYQDISGYKEDELIGQRPAKIKSGHHGETFYQAMWHDLITLGHWEGEIWDRRKNAEVYPKWLKIQAIRDNQEQITHYIGVFYETKSTTPSLYERQRLANIDPLTGLFNRRCYRDKLHLNCQLAPQNAQIIQLYLDIDRFKDINENFGFVIGDDLLTLFANQLRNTWQCINEKSSYPIPGAEEALIARFGGDEFLMGFCFLKSDFDLDALIVQITELFNTPFKIRGHSIQIRFSLGVARLPFDASGPDELIAHAEAAMYVAKKAGGDQATMFTQSIQEQIKRRKMIEQSLIPAIQSEQFELYYQPKVGGLSRKVCGCEALVRWNHPTLGRLSPAEFIPIAEDTGAILPLGDWIFKQACEYAKQLNDLGIHNLPVAVNISASQLADPGWLDRLLLTLNSTQLSTNLIELELTESQLLKDMEHSTELITYVRSLGIKVALDDFGTGYSSLSYLRHLPLDTLKIDRSFVSHLHDDRENYDLAIIKAVNTLAKQLGISLVAEGVEQHAQETILTKIGCDQLQGYLYSEPVPAKEFLALCLRSLTNRNK